MNKHELKTHPQYFQAVLDGKKTFEVRLNDRNYQVGDELLLKEYDPITKEYTGKVSKLYEITYILDDSFLALKPKYVVFSFRVKTIKPEFNSYLIPGLF
jgi:Domain of unknown function (DUF3850)